MGTVAGSAGAPEERLAWTVSVLPYIEQEALAKQIDQTKPWQAKANRAAAATPIRLFRCPSDPGAPSEPLTNYAGVAGVGADAAALPLTDRRAGVFGHDRKVSVADVKDGTSNTILLVETEADNGPWAAGGPATVRGVDPSSDPLVGKGGAFGIVHSDTSWNFGAIRASANMAAADGSVRRLFQNTDAACLSALATIAGGEETPACW